MNEWEKHGTCSESVLNQHNHFEAVLDLKDPFNLLNRAGTLPNGSSCKLVEINYALWSGTDRGSSAKLMPTRSTYVWTNLGPSTSVVQFSTVMNVLLRFSSHHSLSRH